METTYTIKITGGGTKEALTKALQDVITSLIDLEDKGNWEDSTLFTEINKD
jgi:DNA-directed RNA polymerase subunit L